MCLEHEINRNEVADRVIKSLKKDFSRQQDPSFPQVVLQASAYFLNIPALNYI